MHGSSNSRQLEDEPQASGRTHPEATGFSSLLLCVISMHLLFEGQVHIAQALFIASLALMSVSRLFSLGEICISVDALNVQILREIPGMRGSVNFPIPNLEIQPL
jgi:hypothetical protein